MQWVRYGSEKKHISAPYYRESKHGEVLCRYCDGKMAFVKAENRSPHFRVVDRKTHTCKYFGSDLDTIVEACSDSVRMDRKNNESPIFYLKLDPSKSALTEETEEQDQPLSVANRRFLPANKTKQLFKFIFDVHELLLKSEFEQVLQCRFVLEEEGAAKKIKSNDLIPSYKQVQNLDDKGKLQERKRFVVGLILSAKETVKKNIEITLRGEKTAAGSYVNHKVIFMKKVLDDSGLEVSSFYKGRPLVIYAKLKMNETKREIISFVSQSNDFGFGKFTSLDGDWLDSIDEKSTDDYFYLRNISHDIPDTEMAMKYFSFNLETSKTYLMPSWILYFKNMTVVVDYIKFGEEAAVREMRNKFFKSLDDYRFLELSNEDLLDNFAVLKDKLLLLQPNLQLNFYEL
jgi:hypothetical protein